MLALHTCILLLSNLSYLSTEPNRVVASGVRASTHEFAGVREEIT